MVKMNRFIQFNDETVDAKALLVYERLGRALANAPYLELTERKLVEFRPTDHAISMSVFWRHRSEEVTHLGRLSDIYLLTAGFWKHFSVQVWIRFVKEIERHPLREFITELVLLLEEVRLSDVVMKDRPGTVTSFKIRREAYTQFHHTSLNANRKKGFLADALLNKMYISVNEGMYTPSTIDWGEIDYSRIEQLLQNVYDSSSTTNTIQIAYRILALVEKLVENDLIHQYYSVSDALTEELLNFHYHDGMSDAEKGTEDQKDTIEEVFRSWHRESENEAGVHLEYELEHGRSGRSALGNANEGNEDAEVEETGSGRSEGNENDHRSVPESDKMQKESTTWKSGKTYGNEHLNVIYTEQRVEVKDTLENRRNLVQWREVQKPFVRSFVDEMKKRIDLKEISKREHLPKGRLSSKLTTLVIDERPKPFYRKNAPSIQLDAVFGLLVDGSASMEDKIDETKKAVLLFHDVLRELAIHHEIASYFEDANQASKSVQPNVFSRMHQFVDRKKDDGMSILSFETNEDNRDGFAIRWMAEHLSNRSEKNKFLLVFSDGEPSAFGYDRNGILDTAEAVLETEKKGISVIHLFLSTEEPSDDQKELFSLMFGNKTASSNSVEGFSDQTLRILRKLLSIVIRNH